MRDERIVATLRRYSAGEKAEHLEEMRSDVGHDCFVRDGSPDDNVAADDGRRAIVDEDI